MLMMVCAFGGYELVTKAYTDAVKEGYKFGAYGDAMLIIDWIPIFADFRWC